ncbi:unnamed protein product [Closterium sp. NIES-65]|nr:unnamed protein product [Closterium sp. NIES-65]
MAVEREENDLSEAVRGLFATMRGELAAVKEELAAVKGEVAAAVADKAAWQRERVLMLERRWVVGSEVMGTRHAPSIGLGPSAMVLVFCAAIAVIAAISITPLYRTACCRATMAEDPCGLVSLLHIPIKHVCSQMEIVGTAVGNVMASMAGTLELKKMDLRMGVFSVQLKETQRELKGQVEQRIRELAAMKGELKEAERRRVAEMRELKEHQDAVMQLRVEEGIRQSEGDQRTAWELEKMMLGIRLPAAAAHGGRAAEELMVPVQMRRAEEGLGRGAWHGQQGEK